MNRFFTLHGSPPPRVLPWVGATAAIVLTVTLASCATTTTAQSTATPTATATATASASSVVALAEAFAATLTDEQKAALYQDYSFTNASNWSNLPNALVAGGGGPGGAPGGGTTTKTSGGRVGVQTSTLSDEQWAALEALLAAVSGTSADEGFDEIMQHLAADDYLADNGGGSDYGRGQYFIAFLGTPSDSGTWELQFGGHHLAISDTYTDGVLVGATPSFRGIEPMDTVEENGTTVEPEQQERAAFAAVIASLTSDQLATATLSESYNDILLGPGNDWAFPTTYEGIKGSDLTDDQKALLLAAINTYVDDLDDTSAAVILAKYQSELDDTYFSFSGSTSVTEKGDYVRIDGPSVWIEFSMQNGIVLAGAHPHAVWRDKVTDYGGLTS